MSKVCAPRASCWFSLVVFTLLVLSVALLIFVLKGQMKHEKLSHDSAVVHKTLSPDLSVTPSSHQSDSVIVPEPDDTPWQEFRLPKYILPLHYDLLLQPDLDKDMFFGTVNITVNVTRATRHFVVHAYRLSIHETRVYDIDDVSEVGVEKHFPYHPHEYFVISTEGGATPGIYKLYFSFSGVFNGSIVGFYKSRYTNSHNETRYLATSKFQPTYARRAFPCFDEPSFKTTFSVALVHEKEKTALSNMPVKVITPFPNTDLYVTEFKKSVPMVTYLACFIVFDFEFKETILKSGKPFRVYTTADKVNMTSHALQFGSKVLEYFQEYFGIDYPLPKQDMVAIPDFSSGAMEHWGVMTFRETNLLYDPRSSSPRNLQRATSVISHETVHMWFGNLVTMEWWDDLWLNEGFASYVEYKGTDHQFPEWDILSQFITEELQSVINLDSTMSSHPIVQPVNHPDEITEIFDDISYQKGASVLRMLEFFVGKDNFRNGISSFLKKYQFSHAKTSDLWEELSESCGMQGNRSIADIMKTWTEQMGLPFITVVRDKENPSNFIAKQRRFLKNEMLYRTDESSVKDYVWSVPLSYVTESNQSGIIWLHDENELNFSLPINSSEWIKFNVNQTGYYLVNYENEEWQRLINLLMTNHEALSPMDRSNLLFDSFLLAEEGYIGYDIFLQLTKYLRNETHLTPWETAYTSFVYLCKLLESTETNVLLKNYIKDLTGDLYEKLGWKTSKNHLSNLLRTTIIGLACHSGNEDCLSYASDMFQKWMEGQDVPTNLRSLVYNFGMSEIGRDEHWNFMWNKYTVEESPAQKSAIMNGLAHVRNPYLIHKYLEYAMDDDHVRSQDFFFILSYIAGNPVGRPLVWNFMRENWPVLVERFTLNNRYLGNTVKQICSYFSAENELDEMRSFFNKYPDAGAGKRRRQQALEAVQNNIKWIHTHASAVKTWLEMEGSSPWYYYRLPSYIRPEHYDLTLHPNLDTDSFNGSVTIHVDLQRSSDCFLVHALDLNITEIQIFALSGDPVMLVDRFAYSDYVVLKVSHKLPVGKYRLHFVFNALLTSSLKGLYKSSFFDPALGQRKYLAATQFAATYARRAFPCFDEPSFKSTFNVSVIHPSNQTALSNMEISNILDLGPNLRQSNFEISVPMSTYLVSIVVSDFKFKQMTTSNGVRLRVYAAPQFLERTEYALDVTSKIVTYYEDYFGIPYSLSKLDFVAVPDMMYDGMENWGLILYREGILIADNSSSDFVKYRMVRLISHELAHMWFGDLVTMEWWSDVWLSEGFASFMSIKGVKNVEPEWHKNDDFSALEKIKSMDADQTIHSHPVVQPIKHVDPSIYDTIAYEKASALLQMLENYFEGDFRAGISGYLEKYSFSNAETDYFWKELTDFSKQKSDVSTIMNTWSKQMNYPYISVQKLDNNVYGIQQKRFLDDPDTEKFSSAISPYNYIWQIPITYRTAENNGASYVFLNTSHKVNITLPHSDWIKFNVNSTGYYSVNYDQEMWQKLINVMNKNHTAFSPSDRINLLYDAFSLASAGLLDYNVPLNFSRYLKNEEYHGTWELVIDKLLSLKKLFRSEREGRELLKEYIRNLSKDLLRKYGYDDTGDYFQRELRKTLIIAACDNGNTECLEHTSELFRKWWKGEKLGAEIQGLIYQYGSKQFSNEDAWNLMWNRFLATGDPNERIHLLNALATIRNTTILERLMQLAKNESLVRRHEYFNLLDLISKNPKGFPLIIQMIYNKWSYLVSKYDEDKVNDFAAQIFRTYSTEKDLEKVREFYQKQKKDKINRAQTLDAIRGNIRWIERHQKSVRDWLKENVYMPWKNIRLPRHIRPTRYNITLHPNITKLNFAGTEEIVLNVSRNTDYIIFHESGLRFAEIQLRTLGGEEIAIEEEFPYKRNEFHVLCLTEEIPAGLYKLRMSFSGKFSTNGHGINRYQYVHKDTNQVRYSLATRFEATSARSVIPCFDEPAMKAKFVLSIIHEEAHTAVSNMPVKEKVMLKKGLVKTIFSESITMSTYLLFCAVSDFDYLEKNYKGIQVRAYGPPDRIQEAEYGLNLTINLLGFFEDFFDFPYTLPKLDSVLVPNYTVPGMEHWGVITYSTDRFLVNNRTTLRRRIIDIDRVISHEIAHQWFGNLVTMNWWNDLWLSEGLSTLIMYTPILQYYPFVDEVDVRKISRIMCTDSGLDSNPIVRNVTTPDEIAQAFDSISYEKAAAVLKMLQHQMKDDFKTGLSNYLKKFAYKTAETKDLWRELSNVSSDGLNVSSIMDTWTRQMGFPYVELEREDGRLTATQHWFSRHMNETSAATVAQEPRFSRYGFIWKIPFCYKNLMTGNEQTLWLNDKKAVFHINDSDNDVLKFNPRANGFYIVKYDPEDWSRLGDYLLKDHEKLQVTDRYNLLHDAFMLAETGRLVYDIPLELTKYLRKEKAALTWNLFRDHFLHFCKRLDPQSPVMPLLKSYVANLTSDLYNEYVGDKPNRSLFKKQSTGAGSCSYTYNDLELIPTIVDLACRSSNPKCLKVIHEELQLWILGQNITSDVQWVLEVGVSHFGNATLWEYLHGELVANDTMRPRKMLLAQGLASFTQPALIERTIDTVVYDPLIDAETAKLVFHALSRNSQAIPHLWNYTKNHWESLMTRLDAKNNPSVGISAFCKLKTMNYLSQFVVLMKRKPQVSEFIMEGCIEEIQKAVEWNDKYEERLLAWFSWNV